MEVVINSWRIVTVTSSSSCCVPASAWSPSHSHTAPGWVLSTRCSHSGAHYSSVGSLKHHRSSQESGSAMSFPFHRPQLLPGSSFSMGFPWTAASFRAYPLAPACLAGGISAPPWASVGCRKTTSFSKDYLQGNLFQHQRHLLTLLHAQLILTYSHSSLLAALPQYFSFLV